MQTYIESECQHCNGTGKVQQFNYLCLRQRRKYVGKSLRQVARTLQVSAPYLSDVERGRRNVTPKIIEAYSLKALRNIYDF